MYSDVLCSVHSIGRLYIYIYIYMVVLYKQQKFVLPTYLSHSQLYVVDVCYVVRMVRDQTN